MSQPHSRFNIVKMSVPQNKPRVQPQTDTAIQNLWALHAQGRYQEALDICLEIVHDHPEETDVWAAAAFICIYLGRAQDTLRYAQTALIHSENFLALSALA
jgi:tetratricopeptide (TPR) repeat protein